MVAGGHNRKRVLIVETGEIFDSIDACAAHVGRSPGVITYAIERDKEPRGLNLHFEFVDEKDRS